jgi:uncharacterized membrane protein YbhN (UPF0104 family)
MSKKLVSLVKLTLTLLLLGLLIRFAGAREILQAFSGIAWPWAIAMLVAGLLQKLAVSVQLWAILSRAGLTVSVLRVFLANALAALYTLFLPGNIASAGVKWLDLSAATGKKAAVFNGLFYHRLSISLLTLVLGGVAVVVSNPVNNDALSLIAAALVLVLTGLFVFLYHPRLGPWAESLARRLAAGLPPRIAQFITPVIDAMRRFHQFSARDHIEVLAWALVSVVLNIFMLWFAMLAMELDVSPIHILWMSAVLLFTAALPLTVANLGIREGFLVLALAPFGVSSSTAVALGLLIFVNQVGFAAVGGAYQLALALDLVSWKTPVPAPLGEQRKSVDEVGPGSI